MACSASREAEAGRVSASRAGGHAPRTGERVARKSASRGVCVTDHFLHKLAFYFAKTHVPRRARWQNIRICSEVTVWVRHLFTAV